MNKVCCFFFNDFSGQHIIYPVGQHIAFRHLDTGLINFVKSGPSVYNITCICLSNDRTFLAVGEKSRGDSHTTITIYDLKSVGLRPMKVLDLTDVSGAQTSDLHVQAMSFSPDRSLLCIHTGGSEAQCSVWDWRRSKMIATINIGFDIKRISRVTFNPFDPSQICISGPGYIRVLRLREGALRLFPPFEGLHETSHILDHAWDVRAPHVILATDLKGICHVISASAYSVSAQIKNLFGNAPPHCRAGLPQECRDEVNDTIQLPAYSVQSSAQGVIFGGPNGCLSLWTRNDEFVRSLTRAAATRSTDTRRIVTSEEDEVNSKPFTLTRALYLSRRYAIVGMDMAPGCESIALSFANADIGILSLTNMSIAREADIAQNLQIVNRGFHHRSITAISIAAQRPIVVSCSRDEGSIRIWNLRSNECESARIFTGELPTSLSIHPSGFVLAVGFRERVRIFALLNDEFRVIKELPGTRGAQIIQFSNNGGFLSVAHGKMVSIFHGVNYNKVASLKLHSTTVTTVAWSPADDRFATAGMDGLIAEWLSSDWTPLTEFSSRGASYGAMAYDPKGLSLFCAASEGTGMLRELRGGQVVGEYEIESKITSMQMVYTSASAFSAFGGRSDVRSSPSQITRATDLLEGRDSNALDEGKDDASDVRVLVAVTQSGALWIYPLPLATSGFQEIGLHIGAALHVSVSPCRKYLVTAGDDGCIFVMNISGPSTGHSFGDGNSRISKMLVSSNEDTGIDKMGDLTLVPATDVKAQQQQIILLTHEVAQLTNELNLKTQANERMIARATEQVRTQADKESAQLQKRLEAQQATSTARDRETRIALRSLESSHVQAAQALENLYERKLALEAEKFLQLELEKGEVEEKQKLLVAALRAQHDDVVATLKLDHDRQLLLKDVELQKEKELSQTLKASYEIARDQREEEVDEELLSVRKEAAEEHSRQRQSITKLQRELESLGRVVEQLSKDRQSWQRERDSQLNEFAKLHTNLEDLQSQLLHMRRERTEREAVLRAKEARLEEYRNKVAALKKVKHVLQFRLRELQGLLLPKEEEIGVLMSRTAQLEGALDHNIAARDQSSTAVEKALSQISRLTTEVRQSRNTSQIRLSALRKFSAKLHALITAADLRSWPAELRNLHTEIASLITKTDHAVESGLSEAQVNAQTSVIVSSGSSKLLSTSPSGISLSAGGGGIDNGEIENAKQSAAELASQLRVMEQRVSSLALKSGRVEASCRLDIKRKAEENSRLIEELNKIRTEKKSAQDEYADLRNNHRRLHSKLLQLRKETKARVSSLEAKLINAQKHMDDVNAAFVSHGGVLSSANNSPSRSPSANAMIRDMSQQSIVAAVSSMVDSPVPKRPQSANGVSSAMTVAPTGPRVATKSIPRPQSANVTGISSGLNASLANQRLRKSGLTNVTKMSLEDKQQLQNLLLQADVQQQQLQMQKLEINILRGQLSKFMGEREEMLSKLASGDGSVEAAAAAINPTHSYLKTLHQTTSGI